MLNTLIESRRKYEWHPGEATASLVIHSGMLVLLAILTGQAANQVREPKFEAITFANIAPKPKEPPPPPEAPKAVPANAIVAGVPPKGFQVLIAPVNIPDKIPDVDLSKAVTNEEDFSGKGVAGGVARGVEGGTAPITAAPDVGQPYFEFQVEKPVLAREDNPTPKYPSVLESARTEGRVIAQFVVDTLGRVEMPTLRMLTATDELFAAAVRRVMPALRFYPAEVGGRKVRVIVQEPFHFVAPK